MPKITKKYLLKFSLKLGYYLFHIIRKEDYMPKQNAKTRKKEALIGVSHDRHLTLRKAEPVSSGDSNTLSFVMVSSENGGKRYDWFEDEYFIEELDISGASFERLNTFFKDHDRSVDSAIGKVHNVRSIDGELIGDVTFGSDEASQAIRAKYSEGILTDVSVGYEIRGYDVTKRQDDMDLVTITDFSIHELSAVGLGFDGGAKKRYKENEMPEELKARLDDLEKMAKRSEDQEAELMELRSKAKDAEIADLKAKADNVDEATRKMDSMQKQLDENARKEAVRSICDEHGASDEIRAKFEKAGSADELRKEILEARTQESKTIGVVASDNPNRTDMVRAMADGMALKMGAKLDNAHADADMFRNASLLDLGRALTGYTGYDRNTLAKRTLVSPDFPIMLQEAGNKILTAGFNLEQPSYKQWVNETEVSDFKEQIDVSFDLGGELPKIYEGGELNEGEALEGAERWSIDSYGKKFVLTRQMLINDDLRALDRLFSNFGVQASRTANGHVYRLLQNLGEYSGYTMADGVSMYDASRNNSQSLALDSTNLGLARALMRKQVDPTGSPLNIAPEYLVVGADLEQTAYQLLNSTGELADNKNAGVVNPHFKSLTPIVDNAIEADGWYLLAPRRTIQVGYLQGTGMSPVTNIIDTSILGVEIEGVFDFGVMAEDFRGLVKGK